MAQDSEEEVDEWWVVPEKIIDRMLSSTNFRQWKRIVEINLNGRGKGDHLTSDPPSTRITEWKREDEQLLSQLMSAMETGVQDLVRHCETVKELWKFLESHFYGENGLLRAYSVTQALFRCQMGSRSLTEYYGEFYGLQAELRELFPISTDLKKMQKQQEQLDILIFLGGLPEEYEFARSQVLKGSLESLSETYHLLRGILCANPTWANEGGKSTLAAQRKGRGGFSGGGGGGRFGNGRGGGRSGGQLGGRVHSRGYDSSSRDSDSSSSSREAVMCHYCKKFGHMKYSCPVLQEKSRILVRVASTLTSNPVSGSRPTDDEVFRQSQMSQRFQAAQMQPSSSTTLAATETWNKEDDWHSAETWNKEGDWHRAKTWNEEDDWHRAKTWNEEDDWRRA